MTKRLIAVILLVVVFHVSAVAQETDTLDLNAAFQDIRHELDALPAPQEFDLSGYSLITEDISDLLSAYPSVTLRFNVTMYGHTFSSNAALIDFGKTIITDITELKAGLAVLPMLEQVNMYESVLSREQMAELAEAFPDLRFGWTIKLGSYMVRTDITAFSSLHTPQAKRFSSSYYSVLRYCWQLQALDLGHNGIIDLNFMETMTDLRVLILADNRIKDISPLARLTKLEYVELFLNRIKDISPLANMENLLDLNISFNVISNFSPMLSCPRLERLWIHRNNLNKEHRMELEEKLPNVDICYSASHGTGGGWRKHERYYVIKDIFDHWAYQPFSGGDTQQ